MSIILRSPLWRVIWVFAMLFAEAGSVQATAANRSATLPRQEYCWRNLSGWETAVGDGVWAPPGEPPVGPGDIETLHFPDHSLLRANITLRPIMAHNITFKRIVDPEALKYMHLGTYEFRLPFQPSTSNIGLNGETVEGHLAIWDGSSTRLDYIGGFQWIINPWAPNYGAIQIWINPGQWLTVGQLTPDTSWHSVYIVVDKKRNKALITIDGQSFPGDLTAMSRPPDWGTEMAARFAVEIISLYPGGGPGALHELEVRNWCWTWAPYIEFQRAPFDFDGDQKSDPGVHYPGLSQVWWQNSSTGAWEGVWIDPASPYTLVPNSDFDGDTQTDVAIHYTATSTLSWRNSSTGAWNSVAVDDSSAYSLVPLSDFDGDGQTDVAAYYPGLSQVWWRNSSTSVWEGVWIDPSALYTLVNNSDFDGDAKTDVAVYYQSLSQVWWRNSSDGAWQGVWIQPATGFTLITGSDFDGDGVTDIAAYYENLSQVWWRESSTGRWEGVWIYPTPAYALITGSDFDGDGVTDVAAYYESLSQVWWRKSSSGTWEGVWIDPSSPYELVKDVDFDGDGNTDVAAYYAGLSQVWWQNSSTSTWSGVWIDSASAYTLLTGTE